MPSETEFNASYPILLPSDPQWDEARAFFLQKPNATKMSRDKSKANAHSFLKINDEIYVMARREYLGLGGNGKVKEVQNEEGGCYAVKIEGKGLPAEESAEHKVLKILGELKGIGAQKGKTRRLFKQADKPEILTDQKLYTIIKKQQGRELFDEIYVPDSVDSSKYIDNPVYNELDKVRIALRCMLSIQTLHDLNIIHGDVKPENFMINCDGEQIVLAPIDFGYSLILAPGQEEIQHNRVQGTEYYMAPENKQARYSKRSDIYSLGLMIAGMGLYEMNSDFETMCDFMVQDDPQDRIDSLKIPIDVLCEYIENHPSYHANRELQKDVSFAREFLENREKKQALAKDNKPSMR